LSLLYAFGANPHILLIAQTLALASGALPVFLLTRKYIPDWPLLATLMAVVYLISPALLGLNIFDFHPISFATPFLLYAILALTYKRYGWFILSPGPCVACPGLTQPGRYPSQYRFFDLQRGVSLQCCHYPFRDGRGTPRRETPYHLLARLARRTQRKWVVGSPGERQHATT